MFEQNTAWMLCDSQHAWWLTQSRLTTLQPSLIARWWVPPQTQWRLQPNVFQLIWLIAWCSVFGRAHRVQLLDFCFSGSLALILLCSTHIVSSQCWIFIYIFAVLMHWWVKNPLRGPVTLYVCKSQQKLAWGLLERKNGLSSSPSNLFLTFIGGVSVLVYSNCNYSSAFCLSLTYWFRTAWWPSLGKCCPLGLRLVLLFFMPS